MSRDPGSSAGSPGEEPRGPSTGTGQDGADGGLHVGGSRGRHVAAGGALPGSRLIALGVVLFLVGLVAVLVSVVPVLAGTAERSADLPAVLAGTLLPLGLALALGGLLRGARARRRAARRSATST